MSNSVDAGGEKFCVTCSDCNRDWHGQIFLQEKGKNFSIQSHSKPEVETLQEVTEFLNFC